MYCRSCGKAISDRAVVCTYCGINPHIGNKFCQFCGQETNPLAEICIKCGVQLSRPNPITKSKLAAGLLGIFLGGWGVHRFYLGYIGIGIAQIIVTIITCGIGGLWGFIEGILILTGSILQTDADGRPLRE